MKSRFGNNRRVLVKQLGSSLTVIFTVCAASVVAVARTANDAAVVLTVADMSLIADGLVTEERKKLAQSVEERKAFAKDIREMLAVAEAAKADRYADRPELKLQIELARSFAIAQAYYKLRVPSVLAKDVVSQAEIDAFLYEPGTAKEVVAFIDDYQKDSLEKDIPLSDAKLRELRNRYAQVMIAKRKGIAAGRDRERKTQLDIMLQQARLKSVESSKQTSAFTSLDWTHAGHRSIRRESLSIRCEPAIS